MFSAVSVIVADQSGLIRKTADITLATAQNEMAQPLSLYPNPTTGSITLKADQEIQAVQIYSLTGNLIFAAKGVHSLQ